MHEMAITQSILDLVLEQAKMAGDKKVEKVNLVIGELTGIGEQSVQFYFNLISKGTPAEGATLSFTMVPPTCRCRNCNKEFEVKEYDWTCPHCQSNNNNVEIIGGKELIVESIEVK